jgi:hypothetical protein
MFKELKLRPCFGVCIRRLREKSRMSNVLSKKSLLVWIALLFLGLAASESLWHHHPITSDEECNVCHLRHLSTLEPPVVGQSPHVENRQWASLPLLGIPPSSDSVQDKLSRAPPV